MNNTTMIPTAARMPVFALAASLLLLGGLHVASAAEPATGETRARLISLDDLDLSTAEGADAALERVHQAARRMCSQMSDHLDLSHHENYLKCVQTAMAGAQPRLDALVRRDSVVRTAALNPVK
jgi:UrcA family protein